MGEREDARVVVGPDEGGSEKRNPRGKQKEGAHPRSQVPHRYIRGR